MSELKYLSDGRKVQVIGKINNNETIVQEIFITEHGDEVPSGERFVTKSLHDVPVKSYKEKQAEKDEHYLASLKKEKESLLFKIKEIKENLSAYKAIFASKSKLIDLLPEKQAKDFVMFMTGNINYVVIDSYDISPPVKFIDAIKQKDFNGLRRTYEGIKLISLFGNSNGKIEYRIHSYSDGSGGSYMLHFFETYEEAIEHIKEVALSRIEEGRLGFDKYKTCIEMGIVFPSSINSELRKKYLNDIDKNINTTNEKRKEEDQKREERLAEINRVFNF